MIDLYLNTAMKLRLHKALTNWLQGLALDIPFYNDDIKETFGLEDKHLNNYWSYMAGTLELMFKRGVKIA